MTITIAAKAATCLAWLLIGSAAIAIGAPTASNGSITGQSTFEFKPYELAAPVGAGRVNVNSLFYIDENIDNYDFGKGAGPQTVKSWYIFFDPFCQATVEADITFSTAILGVLDKRSDLAATDGTFGLDLPNAYGLDYRSKRFTGTEDRRDSTTIILDDPARRTLHIDWRASNPGDHIRVFTAVPVPVPEPQTVALMLLGLGLVGWAAARRRQTAAD